MSNVITVGLNCSHDAAACLIIDGTVVSAMSEERLTRKKHQRGFPRNAVSYCLKAGSISSTTNVDLVVINEQPPTDIDRLLRPFISEDVQVQLNPSHHYLHACYARMLCRDEPLVVLVVDGSGYSYAEYKRRGNCDLMGMPPQNEDSCEALSAYYFGESEPPSLLMKQWGEWKENSRDRLRFPSLGHMYGAAAQHIFGSWHHAGKVMGLAPYGNPQALKHLKLIELTDDGVLVDAEWMLALPPIQHTNHPENDPAARDIAALVQEQLEIAMTHLCNLLYKTTSCPNICITGGVALNSVFNGQLIHKGPFSKVFLTPAAHDAGVAIGAAAYAYTSLTGQVARFTGDPEFLGSAYPEAVCLEAISSRSDVISRKPEDVVVAVVEDLLAGKSVGWFEGCSEFGPRALGHRSVFVDARDPQIRAKLNASVKFREAFRPYAVAVLAEEASEWFDCSAPSPHMLVVANVKADRAELIPAVVHVDGSCRLQTVSEQSYPGMLRGILEHFFHLTGVPVLLNTSLNTYGEPICETPKDALECLSRSGLDILYLDGHRITKRDALVPSLPLGDAIPLISAESTLTCHIPGAQSSNEAIEYSIKQSNRSLKLSSEEARLILSCLEGRSVADLARLIPQTTESEVWERIVMLCNKGILHLQPRIT
jgi:carbamoyltransferase